MECPACRSPNPPQALFCSHCRAALDGESPRPTSVSRPGANSYVPVGRMRQGEGLRRYTIRELLLHEGERVEERFVPDDGAVLDTPPTGELMVLTNRRVISFVENAGHTETTLASLDELQGVSVKANTKGLKTISQGLFLILAGVLTYLVVGYILLDRISYGTPIALALGGAILFVGLLFVSRYFSWEQEGSITFQGGSWEFHFPYRTDRASADVYKLVNRFFQLKLEPRTDRVLQGDEESPHEAGDPPFSTTPRSSQ